MDTNYTEKAKRLMQRVARTTALVIVPLAAAVNAHAIPFNGPILPPGSPACAGSDSNGPITCSGGASNFSPISTTGIQGVSLYTTSTAFFSGGGTATLILSASGLLSGAGIPSGTVIPLGYDFNTSFLNGELGATVTGWDLEFQLLDGVSVIGDTGLLSGTFSDSGGAPVFDTTTMTTSAAALLGDTLTEQVTLHVSWDAGDSDTLQIDVPVAGTFDFNSTEGLQSVPEPGSMALTGCAFALAGFFLVRRRKGWALVRSSK